MSLFESLTGIAQELKAESLAFFNLPTNGRASILTDNFSRQNLPAREGLGVLVTGNPDYTAYFAPIAPTGSGLAPISFSSVDAMSGGNNVPLPFKIVSIEDGKRNTTFVSEKAARTFSRVVAEMVEASESHKLLALPPIDEIP